MISRRHAGILRRTVVSGTAFPHPAPSQTPDSVTNSRNTSPTTTSTCTSEEDPWAAVLDDATSDIPSISPRRDRLPATFFTSRAEPMKYFSPNFPRLYLSRRPYGTSAKSSRDDQEPSWDHIFDGIDQSSSAGGASPGFPPTFALAPSANRTPRRRKAMTAREISAFDDMFDMIFAAVNKQARSQGTLSERPSLMADSHMASDGASIPDPTSTSEPAQASPQETPPAVGHVPPGKVTDFFGKLRSHSNRMRRTSADDELFDRKKEQIQLCDTDQELLAWALREVFHESETPTPASPENPPDELALYLADPTYPHVLAHLMHIFRTKYCAPHTALALFSHAKRRSIHSYVFGCTTPAYNERLEALWQLEGWAGLGTLEATLTEMRANGVEVDGQTRVLIERVRREVGECVLNREDETAADAWNTLERVEILVRRKAERKLRKGKLGAKQSHWNEAWKNSTYPKLGEDRLTLQP